MRICLPKHSLYLARDLVTKSLHSLIYPFIRLWKTHGGCDIGVDNSDQDSVSSSSESCGDLDERYGTGVDRTLLGSKRFGVLIPFLSFNSWVILGRLDLFGLHFSYL